MKRLLLLLLIVGCAPVIDETVVGPVGVVPEANSYKYCFQYEGNLSGLDVFYEGINKKTDSSGCFEVFKDEVGETFDLELHNKGVYRFSIDDAHRDHNLIIDELINDEFYYLNDAHWGHMPITYVIINSDECGSYEVNKIKRGFDEITSRTDGVVSFKEVTEGADIEISCSFIEDCYQYNVDVRKEEGIIYKWETICDHVKGWAQILFKKGDQILKARIQMIGLAGFAETGRNGASGFFIGSCGHSTTEVHEVLHVFGYGHEQDPASIMYYAEDNVGYTLQKAGACVGSNKEIDDHIVRKLKEDYG